MMKKKPTPKAHREKSGIKRSRSTARKKSTKKNRKKSSNDIVNIPLLPPLKSRETKDREDNDEQ